MTKNHSKWQQICDSVEGRNSARQLAAGVVLGMLIGLLPKDSLLVVGAMVLLILSPANLLTGALSAVFFAFMVVMRPIESAQNFLGCGVLNQEFVGSWITQGWNYPLIPWTRINNSLVCGALVLWALAGVPVYWLALQFFNRLGDQIYEFARGSKVWAWLVGSRTSRLNEG